jgi:glycosyltransferase involved in cell wall biosynthesis
LHVVQVNFLPAPAGLDASGVFERWPSLADIPEAAASAGVRVSVIQAAAHGEQRVRDGVDYRFIDIAAVRRIAERGRRIAGVIDRLDADVLHVHGLGFAADANAVSRHLPRLPVLFQDHADRPPRWWRRSVYRRWHANTAGVAFTALELAQPFLEHGLFDARTRLFAIPESSCRFTLGQRQRARAEAGVYGDPCVAWVGHLNAGKDPLTVLDGVAQVAAQLPDLRLWCAFGSAPLLHDVQRRITQDPRLSGRVHLLGKMPHVRVERLLQSADLFVSGSLAESCGYALLEAMACGATPVVTDIPSFRALTDHGRVGELWPCGDSERLATALWRATQKRTSPARVRAHFDAHLSFAAVGRQWAEAYAQVLSGSGAS